MTRAHRYGWKPTHRCEHRWNLEESGGPEDDFLFCTVCGRQHPGDTDDPYWGWDAG